MGLCLLFHPLALQTSIDDKLKKKFRDQDQNLQAFSIKLCDSSQNIAFRKIADYTS